MKNKNKKTSDLREDAEKADCQSGDTSPSGARARRPVGGPPPEAASMALSVTRHTQISESDIQSKFLSCGIDSLDLGFYVHWEKDKHQSFMEELEVRRLEAYGTQGLLWRPGGEAKIMPSGKPPMYRFHMQIPEAHIYFGITRVGKRYPNVYVSILAEALWCRGLAESVQAVKSFIEALGCKILRIQVSRADVCADVQVKGGVSLDFLRAHVVSRSRHRKHFEEDGKLETYYVGAGSGEVQLRIYDKGKEVKEGGLKGWFLQVWGVKNYEDVWRIEYQLRREALKQFGVETIEDLIAEWGGIWKYLTGEWASVRLSDNENPTRRSLHPFWADVQNCGGKFQDSKVLHRDYQRESIGKAGWYFAHIIGCFIGLAATGGDGNLERMLGHLGNEIRIKISPEEFRDRVTRKCLSFGRRMESG